MAVGSALQAASAKSVMICVVTRAAEADLHPLPLPRLRATPASPTDMTFQACQELLFMKSFFKLGDAVQQNHLTNLSVRAHWSGPNPAPLCATAVTACANMCSI